MYVCVREKRECIQRGERVWFGDVLGWDGFILDFGWDVPILCLVIKRDMSISVVYLVGVIELNINRMDRVFTPSVS